jgi:hypothetical protein
MHFCLGRPPCLSFGVKYIFVNGRCGNGFDFFLRPHIICTLKMEDALNLIGTQVIVRLEATNHCGYLLSFDPRSSTAALITQHSIRVIHGHQITTIEPDTYCDPISENTKQNIKSFKTPLFACSQTEILDQLRTFLQDKGVETEFKDDVVLMCNGFVKIKYPYYKSCVLSNNKELLHQYRLLLEEFYASNKSFISS